MNGFSKQVRGCVLMLAAAQGTMLPCPAQSETSAAVAAPALPASPADLFSDVAKDVRPQWRQFFREIVPHAGDDRYESALALGAVCADCYMAAEARDAQQVLNLLTDMAALEMTLSISRQAGGTRQKFKDLAEAGDWTGVRAEIAALMAVHAQSLIAQQDENLAELERTGMWLRAFHSSARYSTRQKQLPGRACIWSRAMLEDLLSRTVKASAGREAKSLQTLVAGLESLTRTWTTDTPAPESVATTLKTLDALMAELIGDTPATSTP